MRITRNKAFGTQITAVVAVSAALVVGIAALAGTASAETPAERCKRETAAYNAAWKQSWLATHPGADPSDAPPPAIPYKCGQPPATVTPTTSAPTSSSPSATPTSSAAPSSTTSRPSRPSTDPLAPDTVTPRGALPTINAPGAGIDTVERAKLQIISERNYNTPLQVVKRTLESYAQKVSKPYSQVLTQAANNALSAVPRNNASDNGGPNCRNGSASSYTPPAPRATGEARHRGDYFFSKSCTFNFNHGHNGIFINSRDTVEASNEETPRHKPGVFVSRGSAFSKSRIEPRMYAVKAQDWEKDKAADVAEGYPGRNMSYNNSFYDNRKSGDGVTSMNCSQVVWAAWWDSSSHKIDLDHDGGPGVYPKDLARTGWSNEYPT